MSLKSRLILRGTVILLVFAAMLFLPAGTLKFWEAWVFLGIVILPVVVFSVYYFKRDPQMMERRMQVTERVKEQKVIMGLVKVIWVVASVVPSLDHRFGWTHKLVGALPTWLEIVAQAVVLGGYLLIVRVMDVNRFASSTIQVEPGQKVISGGPYALVRHPMYFSFLAMWLATPLALGSYVGLPFFALLVPFIVWRLLNEEKVLRQELPGYEAYCHKTRFRLVPYVW